MNRLKRIEELLKRIQNDSTGVIVVDKNEYKNIDHSKYKVIIIDDIWGELWRELIF